MKEVAGVVLGAKDDYEADTGAISGYNAATIVPEDDVDLSTLPLPDPGSTTQITYTGDDGKSFTFNVKWPRSFTEFVSGTAIDNVTDPVYRLQDSRFLVDLNNFDENELFYKDNPESAFFFRQCHLRRPLLWCMLTE